MALPDVGDAGRLATASCRRFRRHRRRDRPRIHQPADRRTGDADHRLLQLLRPREKTRAARRVCCTNYHVVEGAGHSIVGGQRLDWEDKDVFTVPTWTFHEHVNSGDRPAFLFSFSDAPVMKALSLYREETRA